VQRRLTIHLAKAATICPRLAGKHVTVHTLRHTAAMRFLDTGIDAAVIALWLGHESTATTSIYPMVFGSALARAPVAAE